MVGWGTWGTGGDTASELNGGRAFLVRSSKWRGMRHTRANMTSITDILKRQPVARQETHVLLSPFTISPGLVSHVRGSLRVGELIGDWMAHCVT